jgi:hypothetical protein
MEKQTKKLILIVDLLITLILIISGLFTFIYLVHKITGVILIALGFIQGIIVIVRLNRRHGIPPKPKVLGILPNFI